MPRWRLTARASEPTASTAASSASRPTPKARAQYVREWRAWQRRLTPPAATGKSRRDLRPASLAIMRVHEAGLALRQSTVRWFAENAESLSLEHSLSAVLESYGASARR